MKKFILHFLKMHGLGNDFVVIDGLSVTRAELAEQTRHLKPRFAKEICDRRRGVGADQILWIKPARSREAFARMEVLNADGSVAEMCGNGIRAVALYLQGLQPTRSSGKSRTHYLIETLAGILTVEMVGKGKVRVDMGPPRLGAYAEGDRKDASHFNSETVRIAGGVVQFWEVSMGNPHAVIFVDSLENCPAEEQGPLIERHRRFPNRTNVEYVEVKGSHKIQVRVWERGAGFTLACGTGACAAAVAAIATGRVTSPVQVELPGGALQIEWNGKAEGSVFMTGPALEVFRGEIRC